MTLMDSIIEKTKKELQESIWIDIESNSREYFSAEESEEIYADLQKMFLSIEKKLPEYLKKISYENTITAEFSKNKYLG